jgi:hypothetical protein
MSSASKTFRTVVLVKINMKLYKINAHVACAFLCSTFNTMPDMTVIAKQCAAVPISEWKKNILITKQQSNTIQTLKCIAITVT